MYTDEERINYTVEVVIKNLMKAYYDEDNAYKAQKMKDFFMGKSTQQTTYN